MIMNHKMTLAAALAGLLAFTAIAEAKKLS
jgi:hypothetical protein